MKGIKVNETLWLQYSVNGKLTHAITSNIMRDTYYLYEIIDGQAVKTKYKADTPTELEKWIK
jgi:hypothetical protein